MGILIHLSRVCQTWLRPLLPLMVLLHDRLYMVQKKKEIFTDNKKKTGVSIFVKPLLHDVFSLSAIYNMNL